MAEGQSPRALDKEYVRTWLVEQGFTGDGQPPALPEDVRVEAAMRYIETYERMTGAHIHDPGKSKRLLPPMCTLYDRVARIHHANRTAFPYTIKRLDRGESDQNFVSEQQQRSLLFSKILAK